MAKLLKWSALPLAALLLGACGGTQKPAKSDEQPLSGERGYRAAYAPRAAEVKEGLASGRCHVNSTCGELSFVDCGMAADGPAYYVRTSSHEVLEVCGGACMSGPRQDMCVACPPPEWTCGR
ncbi:hypothetical protein FGE12_17705 [Aggregicoccus sp. 17bor-14]|uniref:hypothetical protein n=1 Tax=Myxococcaceae TaxID=31 RepID=UPI00129D1F9B|nr:MULTISPECIES: hypothetical protein [Myxococcaceae]MBF5044238.1 hypothetical protein [Simulacricoccus sp. 17bor-14]MRI89988.1 hypothetical protein [Aggregicoccus sp. 17bor-14]